MTTLEPLLAEYDHEIAVTRKLLERIPRDRLDWKPHTKSTSMVGLGRHLAHMITWGLLALTQRTSDVGDRSPMEATPTLSALLRIFDANAARVRELLASQTDAQLAESWSLTWQGRPVLSSPRAAVVQSMILNHLIHHRGQLSVYLRLNDVPVPAIYGPSADES
jgi:uncharacterized damage-inducible protein DinB